MFSFIVCILMIFRAQQFGHYKTLTYGKHGFKILN